MALAPQYNAGRQIQSPIQGYVDVDQGGAVVASTFFSSGTVAINGAIAITVNNPAVTANSQILFTLKTIGGTVGPQPHLSTVTPGTGFQVIGTAGDSSVYNYTIIG